MKAEEIEITIDPQGDVRLAVRGVAGKGCVSLTKPFEDALGAQVQDRTFTSEYYQAESAEGQRVKEGKS